MSDLRCGPLAAWANAFVAGHASLDQVVDETTWDTDARHRVENLPAGDTLSDLLVAWRCTGEPVRCVLPVPGDVRGLTGPAGFRQAALEAGEAAIAGLVGAVPEVVDFGPSSAPWQVTWRVWALEPGPADYESVADVQYDLTTAIRETASALVAADVGGGAGSPDALRDARHAGEIKFSFIYSVTIYT